MSITPDCTEACEASPRCDVCQQTKPPIGRSVPLEAANGMCCPVDCVGYHLAPKPGHLWPGELRRNAEAKERGDGWRKGRFDAGATTIQLSPPPADGGRR